MDGVELVMGFESEFGITIPDAVAARMLTPRMVLEYVATRVPVVQGDGGCATQRTFYALRRGLRASVPGDAALRPETPLDTVADRASWPSAWARVRAESGQADWPAKVPWQGFWSGGPATLGELTRHVVLSGHAAKAPWTPESLELTLRRVVWDVIGVLDFALDDEFVRDMGVS